MENRNGCFARIRLVVLASGLLVASGSVLAESSCKGLSQSKCEGNAGCSWVSSYETKNGVKVDAYCRAKSSKSTGAGEAKKSDKAKQAQQSSQGKKKEESGKGKTSSN